MKKNYIKPEIKVIKVEATLLCSVSNKRHHHDKDHHRPPYGGDCKDPWRPREPWDRNPWN